MQEDGHRRVLDEGAAFQDGALPSHEDALRGDTSDGRDGIFRAGLFDGRACIICNQEESAPAAVRMVERLYDCLNMRPIYMNAASHDVHTAYVSHISHITSFALALTVLDKEKNEKHIFDLASGGFSSTVRLAKSNADMWVPIFSQNRENLLKVIDTYIEKVNAFRQAIDEFDEDGIRSLIEDANRIKRIIR